MAEFVEYKQELLLPAYEELERSKLATESAIRDIKKRRDELEYKMITEEKKMKTYGEYIVYEKSLLKLFKKREKKGRPEGHEDKMKSIEDFIKNHVKSLFKKALQIFYAETRLWHSYITALIEFEDFAEVSNSYEKILQYHSDKPEVWLDAIEWESRNIDNMSKVHQLLLRAIQKHPKNININAKFFKIALIQTEKLSTDLVLENNTASERDVALKRIEVMYANSKEHIDDVKYVIKVLHYLEKYPYTKRIQKIVINDMLYSFPNSEETWHTFAIRELNGLSVADVLDETRPGVTRTQERNIQLCCDVYEAAVKTLGTVTMWELYIQTMLQLNLDTSTQKSLKEQKLYNALVGAYQADSLSEKHFEIYINLLTETQTINNEVIEQVMKKATTIYPRSKNLCKLLMEYYIKQDDPKKVYDTFTKGVKLLEKKGYELWKIIIFYYLTRSDSDYEINKIYREAIKITDIDEFLEYRIQFLEWTLISENIDKTRQLYDEMTGLQPKYYKLHEKMVKIESNQIEPNIDRWRKCYENMIHFFGKDQIDVWINYIKFERDNGNGENMSVLYEKAKITLNTSLLSKFLEDYTLLSTG